MLDYVKRYLTVSVSQREEKEKIASENFCTVIIASSFYLQLD